MYAGWSHGLWFGGFGMILVWIIVVIGIVWLIRSLIGPGRHHPSDYRSDSSIEVLKRRYAAGEITRREFEQKKHDILSS